MKKIIAKIACATILSMGIITNTAICADKEVKTEITQVYPNIAAEGKTLEKQIASVIKAVKNVEKKAKAFNKIAMKESITPITISDFKSIQTYFEKANKAIAAIRKFKSAEKIKTAITNAKNAYHYKYLEYLEKARKKPVTASNKAKKAFSKLELALNTFSESLKNTTAMQPAKEGKSFTGCLKDVHEFLVEFHNNVKAIQKVSDTSNTNASSTTTRESKQNIGQSYKGKKNKTPSTSSQSSRHSKSGKVIVVKKTN